MKSSLERVGQLSWGEKPTGGAVESETALFDESWEWSGDESQSSGGGDAADDDSVSDPPEKAKPTFREYILSADHNGSMVAYACRGVLVLEKLSTGEVVVFPAVEDVITEVVILSLAASAASGRWRMSQRCCLVVGYESGFIRFFSEEGELILEQRLHNSPVVALKVRWLGASRQSCFADHLETLTVLHRHGVIVHVEGFNLYSVLRACFYQREKSMVGTDPIALAYRKLQLEGQMRSSDVVCRGPVISGPLCVTGGQEAADRFISGGSAPVLACFVASKNDSTLSAAVALASNVASKLTSAVFSFAKTWLSAAPESESVKETKNAQLYKQRPESIPLELALEDAPREIWSLSIDPTGSLIVATDGLARVLLMDATSFVVIRMWKGFRDAQCAWIETPLHSGATSLLLCIFAPRRRALEIWKMQMGPRIASIEVDGDCRLLNPPSLLGAAEETPSHVLSSRARAFLVSSNGTVDELHVQVAAKEGRSQDGKRSDRDVDSIDLETGRHLRFLQSIGGISVEELDVEGVIALFAEIHSPPWLCRGLWTLLKVCPQNRQAMLHLAVTNAVLGMENDDPQWQLSVSLAIEQTEFACSQVACGELRLIIRSNVCVSVYLRARARVIAAFLNATSLPETLPFGGLGPSVEEPEHIPDEESDRQVLMFDRVVSPDVLTLSEFLGSFAVEESGQLVLNDCSSAQVGQIVELVYGRILEGVTFGQRADEVLSDLDLTVDVVLKLFEYWCRDLPSGATMSAEGKAGIVGFVEALVSRLTPEAVLPLLCEQVVVSTDLSLALVLAESAVILALEIGDADTKCSIAAWKQLISLIHDAVFLEKQLAGPVIESIGGMSAGALAQTGSVARLLAVQQIDMSDRSDEDRDMDDVVARNFGISSSEILCHRAVVLLERWQEGPGQSDFICSALREVALLSDRELAMSLGTALLSGPMSKLLSIVVALVDEVHAFPKPRLLVKAIQMDVSCFLKVAECLQEMIEHFGAKCSDTESPRDEEIDFCQLPAKMRESGTLTLPTWNHVSGLVLCLSVAAQTRLGDIQLTPLFPKAVFHVLRGRVLEVDEIQDPKERSLKREEFVGRVMRCDRSLALQLVSRLRVDSDAVLTKHIVWLYRRGRDAEAEELVQHVRDEVSLGVLLLAVARRRAAAVFSSLDADRRPDIVARIPIDTQAWITEVLPIDSGGEGEERSLDCSLPIHALALTAHALAHLVVRLMGEASNEAVLAQAHALAVATEGLSRVG